MGIVLLSSREEAPRVRGRAEQVRCLLQTGELIRSDKCYILSLAPAVHRVDQSANEEHASDQLIVPALVRYTER